MWSLRKLNLTPTTRTFRQSLLQQNSTVDSPQVKSFNAIGVKKIAQSPKQITSARNEFLAVVKLLKRSSLNSLPISRHLSTSIRLFEKESDKNKSSEPDQPKSSDTSNNNQNEFDAQKDSDGKKSDKKEGKKKSKGKMPEDNSEWSRSMAMFMNSIFWFSLIYGIGYALLAFMSSRNEEYPNSERYVVSWKEFVQYMLAAGEVKELIVRPQFDYVKIILHPGAVINGRRSRFPMYLLQIPNVDHFEQRLREIEKQLGISESIPIRYERTNEAYGKLIALAVLIGIIALIAKNVKVKMGNMSSSPFSMGKAKVTVIEKGKGKGVYFKDVAGLKEAKIEIIEFVDYLKNPARYQALGARVPKGALLLGPPGCGKTLLAKAVATEAGVPFLTMNGSEFIEMIGGLGAARVRDLFKKAKKKAPCIIYIDEIDAIGRQRSSNSMPTSGESEQTLNQLLVELDGMASKEGILMLASTNRADVLDKALLRPGRFDRHIEIDLPTLEERVEIFEKHLSGVTLEKTPSEYSRRLAILSPGFSGADIANVCNEAALHAARFSKECVAANDLEYAIERCVGGTEKRSNALSAEERRTVAYHESGHALVGWMLEYSDVLQKVTIVPRTNLALGFAQYTPHDQKLFTKEQLTDKIRMALGGRVAENITFQKITTGAQNDLEKVTKIAFAMVAKYGMSETLGPMYVPDEPENQHPWVAEKPFSNALNNIIDMESRKIITDAYFHTETILKTNREKLVTLAEALLKQETLNYDQVVELIGPPKYESAKRKIDPVEFEQSLNNLSKREESTGANDTANAK